MSDVLLDFSVVSNEDEMWATIREGLCPRFTHFGSNLDALVDVLRGGFGIDTPIKLRILGRESAMNAVGCARWQMIEMIFTESLEGTYGEDVESIEWV